MTPTPPDPDALADALARTGRTYDAVPYTSIPFPRLQPARLAANARLLGLDAPDPSRARTLEIGCASGGHIVPLAAAFPQARFVGVDISAGQVASGRERIDALGLRNVELHACSVTEIGADWGDFDYVICHGVYSWVPDAVRENILRVCAERLSPDGIAAISFNVLPGWRMFQVVRDSMILHAGAEADHQTRSLRSRQLFDLMAQHSPEASSYGSIWRKEARRMVEQPDAYLAHEIFEDHNAPCTFRSFADAAARRGLAYLSETRLRENVPESGQAERAEVIRSLAAGDRTATEQYIDILTGRTFRESLLVRAGREAGLSRGLDPERLAGLHLIAPLDLRADPPPRPGEFVLADDDGMVATTQDHAVAAALDLLLKRQPASTAVDDLVARAETEAERDRILAALLRLVLDGALDVSAEPVRCASRPGDTPTVWPLLAQDIMRGADRSATLRHATVSIDPMMRFLAPLLDGRHDAAGIADALMRLAQEGLVSISDETGAIAEPDRLAAACRAQIDRRIAALARMGALLEDQPPPGRD
ncbi:class I SAM-dependent methyltransferase [Alsobacter sp. KACC 23698]|uniref:Class I SAM-dependent methyltransferase n=1 Tax=Alsobacter sp. KACC 23698 TaxID=3149229 RepID=A0AAU7JM20_9HYPH